MPLIGEYEPSTWSAARDQVELFEKSQAEGNTLLGLPVVIITTTGKSSGRLRKTPVMRVEHDGRYSAVSDLSPRGRSDPLTRCRSRARTRADAAAAGSGRSRTSA
jgi:hypothetical protein